MQLEAQSVIDDVVSNIVIAPTSNTHIELATKIAERALGKRGMDLTYMSMDPRRFSVGEFCPRFILDSKDDLKDKTVYIVMTPGPYKTPEELNKRAEMVAFAAKQHGAGKVVLLATDFPHARQDRGPNEDEKAIGELNTVRMHARLYEAAGIDEVITTHAHSSRVSSFFALEYGLLTPDLITDADDLRPREMIAGTHFDPNDLAVQALGGKVFKPISTHAVLADYLLHRSSEQVQEYLRKRKIAAKAIDGGNKVFRNDLCDALFMDDIPKIDCKKGRKKKNDPNEVEIEIVQVHNLNPGDLDEMMEIFADDGLDTGGTMLRAVKWSQAGNVCSKEGIRYGTPADRFVYFTHAWLGGESHQAIQRRLIDELPALEFVTTNTRPYISDGQFHRFKRKSTVLRLAGLWADAIIANELGEDITTRYQGFDSEEYQHQFLMRVDDPLYVIKRHSSHFSNTGHMRDRKIQFYRR